MSIAFTPNNNYQNTDQSHIKTRRFLCAKVTLLAVATIKN